MIGVLIGEQPCEEEMGECPMTTKAEIGLKQLQAQACKKFPANLQKLGFRERAWPCDTLLQTSSLQNYEMVNLCCPNPSSLWLFAAKENKSTR